MVTNHGNTVTIFRAEFHHLWNRKHFRFHHARWV